MSGPNNDKNELYEELPEVGNRYQGKQKHEFDLRYGPAFDRIRIDNRLKHVGSSVAAVEIHKIQAALDYSSTREDIAADKVGMIGLSYGGFFTLFAAAADTRIKAAYSSCFINDRFVYDWPDFTWFNAGNAMPDAEVCGLVCPRPLHLEVGVRDELFLYEHARRPLEQVQALYESLNVKDRLSVAAFDGTHELDADDRAIEWFLSAVTGAG